MKSKFLVISLSIIVLLGILGVLFYMFLYKGTLTIKPQTAGMTVQVDKKQYTSFPIKLKLSPGSHLVKYYKSGYISQTESINIFPFKIISFEPILREVYLVNYIGKQNFLAPVFSPEGQYIYYYDSAQKQFMKLPAYYTKKDVEKVFSEPISLEVSLESKNKNIKVAWSPLKTKAALVFDGEAIVYDLAIKKEYPIENIGAISFIDENQIYYTAQSGGLFKSSFDGSGSEIVSDINFKSNGIELSPGKGMIAMYGDSLTIFDLAKKSVTKKIEKNVNSAAWGSDKFLAYTQAKDSDSELFLLKIGATKGVSDLGLISNKAYAWRGTDLAYASLINYHPKVVILNTDYGIKNTLFAPDLLDEPRMLLVSGDKLIFSSTTGRGKLLAIKLD